MRNEMIERMFTMVQQQLPTGFRDDIGAVAERKDDVSQYVLGLCRSRQYTKISTPLVEYKDVFNGYAMGRGQHMYEFMDSSDESVVIRKSCILILQCDFKRLSVFITHKQIRHTVDFLSSILDNFMRLVCKP